MRHVRGSDMRLGLFLIGLCAGCDALVPEGYAGERLLSVRGSAEVDGGSQQEGLAVALAFVARGRESLRLLDAEASGGFPNQFSLDVYERPADDVLITPKRHPEAGRAALALIAAVPPRHAEHVALVSTNVMSVGTFNADCRERSCACSGEGCERTSTTCLRSDDTRCFTQKLLCPEIRSPDDACRVVSMQGDEAVTRLPWSELAGVSQNYVIVYLEQAAPAGSYYASELADGAALAAGYHLIAGEKVAGSEGCEPGVDADCRGPSTQLRAVSTDEPIEVTIGKVLPLDFLNL